MTDEIVIKVFDGSVELKESLSIGVMEEIDDKVTADLAVGDSVTLDTTPPVRIKVVA